MQARTYRAAPDMRLKFLTLLQIAGGTTGLWISSSELAPLFPPEISSCTFATRAYHGKLIDSGNRTRADYCTQLHWVSAGAHKTISFGRIDPLIIMRAFKSKTTIHFVGDSTSVQSSMDLACHLSALMQAHRILRGKNDGITGLEANFSLGGSHLRLISRKVDLPTDPLMRNMIATAHSGDVVVLNSGLHLLGTFPRERPGEMLVRMLVSLNSTLRSAQDRGVLIFWRETIAGHFDTPTGYWDRSIRDSWAAGSAHCVDHVALDRDKAWRMSTNNEVVPWMNHHGITVLPAWLPSFEFPARCHVGMGKDCLHVLVPSGILALQTNLLLSALVEKKRNNLRSQAQPAQHSWGAARGPKGGRGDHRDRTRRTGGSP